MGVQTTRSAPIAYTTLFRSDLQRPVERAAPVQDKRRTLRRLEVHRATDGRGHSARRPVNGDRKSTRLNSSHVEISYAVYCLKKKTSQRLIAIAKGLKRGLAA